MLNSLLVVAAAVSLLPLLTGPASAGPVILPQGSSVAGQTVPEYTAQWWQTALEVPFSQSPLTDPMAAEDVGAVTFLYGPSSPDPVISVNRSVTIQDDFILFPVLNGFFAITSTDPPGTTVADAREVLAGGIDEIQSLFATIDGVSVPMSELLLHREQSPVFTLDLPEGNLFGIPPEFVDETVSDGYWLMLEPLGPGEHTLSFGGQFGPTFNNQELRVDYAVSVIPLPAAVWMMLGALPLAAAGRRMMLNYGPS